MRLDVAKTSDIKRPLVIMDRWEVMVRHLTRKERQALVQRCSRPKLNAITRQYEDTVDEDLWLKHAPQTYVEGWTGLTRSTLRKLVVLNTEPEENADGEISFDEELLRDLWDELDADVFSAAIMNMSRGLLTAIDLERKKNSTASVDT